MNKAKLIIALVLIATIALATGIYATTSADSNADNLEQENQNEILVGGTPGSCGYIWDAERYGWHRPWDPDSFIPASEKPEWDQYIAR